MAGGLFNRLKIWAFEEVLKSKDLNAEFDNIINHLSPQFIASFSQTISQMQLQLDPGGLGTENLAQSDAQEIEQLRFVIARIIGLPFWYQSPAISLQETNDLINQIAGLPPNRIVSGDEISASNQMPAYLIPSGTTNSITIKGTTTPLVFRIKGTQYTLSSDVVLSGLVMAPATNNTALVNDPTLVGDVFSTVKGEYGSTLNIDTAGTAIAALIGSYAAFKIVDGGNTEYFTAFVQSPTQLVSLRRGFFFDSTVSPLPRITINDNDVITLMKLTFLFIHSDLTAEAVYTNPTYSAAQPSSPAVGDYWFNMTTNVWNRFTGSSWVDANATLIGIVITNTTATIGARPQDFFANVTRDISLELDYVDVTEVHGTQQQAIVDVMGKEYSFGQDDLVWDITTDLESGFIEATSTMYFLYITELGAKKMSPIYPQLRQDFDGTFYHPYLQWRAVGMAFNDASSNLVVVSNIYLSPSVTEQAFLSVGNGFGSTYVNVPRFSSVAFDSIAAVTYVDSVTLGTGFICFWPCTVSGIYTDVSTAGTALIGWAINFNGASSIGTVGPANYLGYSSSTSATIPATGSFTAPLKIGDVLRPQGNANVNNTGSSAVKVLRIK